MLQLTPIPILKTNYVWALTSATAPGKVVIIDPGAAAPVLSYIDEHQLELVAILITHHHYDHTDGVDEILHAHNCPVYAGRQEPISQATIKLADKEKFTLPELDLTFQALHVPGHTNGHTAYYGHDIVFTGDTLFAAGCGRNFEGTSTELYHSLLKLAELPMETQIYCGHEYTEQNLSFGLIVEPDNQDMLSKLSLVQTMRTQMHCTLPSSLADEMNTNIFYRAPLPQVKAAAEHYAQTSLHSAEEVFTVLRKWKNNF